MINFAWNLILLAIGCFAALSLGTVVMRCFVNRYELRIMFNPLERLCVEFVFGIGLLAGIWQVLGLLAGRWFTPFMVLLVLAGIMFIGRKTAIEHLRSGWRQARLFVVTGFKLMPIAWRVVSGLVIGLYVIYFFTSLLPPKGDAMAFYMVLPKLMAYNHELLPAAGFETFSQVGMLGEMHFAALLMFGGEMACGMLVYVMGFVCSVLLAAMGRRCGMGFKGQWVILAMLLCSTGFTRAIYDGKCDLFGVAMSLVCLLWVLQIDSARPKLKCVFAGIFAAWAFQAKMTYMVTVFPMAGVLMLWRSSMELENFSYRNLHFLAPSNERRKQKSFRRTLFKKGNEYFKLLGLRCWWMILGGLIALIPHFLKDLVLYKSFMPFMFTATDNTDFWFPRGAHELLVLKVAYPLALWWGQMNTAGHLSMILPAVLPLVLLLKRPKRWREFFASTTVQLTVIAWLGVAIWGVLFFKVFCLRYFLPPLLLVFLLPAKAVEEISLKSSRKVLVGFVLGAIFAGLAATYNRPKGHPGRGLAYMFGFKDRSEVAGPFCRFAEYINPVADGKNEKVFVASAYRYYLSEPLLNTSNSKEFVLSLADLSPGDRWRKLYESNYKWLIVGPQTTKISDDGRNIKIVFANRQDPGNPIILDSKEMKGYDLELIKAEGSRPGKKPYQYGLYKIVEGIYVVDVVTPTTQPK